MSAFLESSLFLAYLNADEPRHADATRLVSLARGGSLGALFTSDYVYDETVSVALRKAGPKAALEADALFHAPRFLRMLRVSEVEFAEARRRFLAGMATGLSLTDWTIVVQCERRGVRTILSFDRGFDGIYSRTALRGEPGAA